MATRSPTKSSKSPTAAPADYAAFAKALMGLTRDAQGTEGWISLLYGPSDYLMIRALRALKEKLQDRGLERYDGPETSDAEFRNLWQQSGLFGGGGVAVFHRCEKWGRLIELLQEIPPDTAPGTNLILVIATEKLSAKISKEVERLKIRLVPCFDPHPDDMPAFTNGLARRSGVTLTPEALRLLVQHCGNSPAPLEDALTRISLAFDGHKHALDAKDIAPYLGSVQEEHVFALDGFLMDGQPHRAQSLIVDLLRRGESALAINGILARHARQAARIAHATQVGQSLQELSSELRLPWGVIRRYQSYVARRPAHQFLIALDRCRSADIRLKTGRDINSDATLFEIVADLTDPVSPSQ